MLWVSMVFSPRFPTTAPRAPASRDQSLPQTPPRTSRPMQWQDSKILHVTDRTVVKQKEFLLS